MSLSYSEDLWGGIKAVYDHYEEGRKTLAFLIDFFKERITAEEKHAAKLEKQASKATAWTELETIGEGWRAIKLWQEISSKHLASVATQLQNEVMNPLVAFKKDAEKTKDTLHKEVDKLDAQMVKMKDLLAKAKAKYVKACSDYEKSTLDQRAADPVGTKPKDMEKLRHRVTADKTHADQAHDAYKQQISAHREFQQQFEEQYRSILQQFGELEMKRREQIKEVFNVFLGAQDHYSRSMTETVIPLRTAIEAIDSKADQQHQLEKHKTGLHPDAMVDYEPYVTENSVDVPADPVENGNRANATLERSRSKSMKVAETKKDKEKDKKDKKDKDKKKVDEAPPPLVAPPVEEPKAETNGAGAKHDETASSAPTNDRAEEREKKRLSRSDQSDESNPPLEAAAVAASAAAVVAESPRSDKKVKSPRTKRDKEKTDAAPAASGDKRPPVAKALYEYDATDETEISFKEGDLIIITLYDGEVPDCPGWMKGRCKGQEGIFPANHAELVPEFKLCKATFDFDVSEPEELALKEGDILIIEATHEDWFEGRNEKDETGIFPSPYVTLL